MIYAVMFFILSIFKVKITKLFEVCKTFSRISAGTQGMNEVSEIGLWNSYRIILVPIAVLKSTISSKLEYNLSYNTITRVVERDISLLNL